jgi:hypothetical protein
VIAVLFHEDVWSNLQTDLMKLTVAFHNFVTVHKIPKNNCDLKVCKTIFSNTNLIAITMRWCD